MAFIKKFVKPFAVSASKDIMRDTIMDDAVAGGLISCTYPLNATPAEYTALGYTQGTMSNANQTMSFTLISDGVLRRRYGIPTGAGSGTSQKFGIGTGHKAIEFLPVLPVPTAGETQEQNYNSVLVITSPAGANKCQITIEAGAQNAYAARVTIAAGTVLDTGYTLTSPPTVVGVSFDSVAGTLMVIFDNVVQTLSSNAYTPGDAVVALQINEYVVSNAGNAGGVVSGTIRTDAAAMTTTSFAAGTTDMCGTII